MFTEIFTDLTRRPLREESRNGPRHTELGPIGAAGFEPATSCSQSRHATGLRHAPSVLYCNNLTTPNFSTKPNVCK